MVQSTIYIIVELQREEQSNDIPSPNLRLGGNSAKEQQKENTPTIKTEPAENFDIVTSNFMYQAILISDPIDPRREILAIPGWILQNRIPTYQ